MTHTYSYCCWISLHTLSIELTVYPRLALSSSCFRLLSTRMTDMQHHTWLSFTESWSRRNSGTQSFSMIIHFRITSAISFIEKEVLGDVYILHKALIIPFISLKWIWHWDGLGLWKVMDWSTDPSPSSCHRSNLYVILQSSQHWYPNDLV